MALRTTRDDEHQHHRKLRELLQRELDELTAQSAKINERSKQIQARLDALDKQSEARNPKLTLLTDPAPPPQSFTLVDRPAQSAEIDQPQAES